MRTASFSDESSNANEGLAPYPGGMPEPADPLPEYVNYRDAGCDLSPSCLECPFDSCRHDRQAGRRLSTRLRDEKLLKLRASTGKSIAELAATFNVSRRTVQRIVRRATNEQHC